MDCYNDTMCETVSGVSWPSRSLTTVYSDQPVDQFAQNLGCNISQFKLTSVEMHYRDTNVYYEMISCIAEVCKNNLLDELNECDAVGIQIHGSCDRQQLGIKFVTARLIQNRTIYTRFLLAIEPRETGANGLLEALGRSLEQPGDVRSHTLQFYFNDNVNINDDYGILEALGRSLEQPGDVRSHTLQFNFNDNVNMNDDYAEKLQQFVVGHNAATFQNTGLWNKKAQHRSWHTAKCNML